MNPPVHRRAQQVTLAIWGGLLLWLLAWWMAPGPAGLAGPVLAGVAAPLFAPLQGLWRGQRRSYRWAPLTLAPVLAWSLTELLANPTARTYAITAAALSILALAAIVATLRSMPAQD